MNGKEDVVHTYSGILFSHRNEFESAELKWMNLESVIQSEVSLKDKNIVYNACMWNMEKWY